MSSEELHQDDPRPETGDSQMHEPPTAPAAMAGNLKKRPRLDLTVGRGERKRGKSMFGVLVNTLNKAKAEDKERNASEAAKKRQMIEQRLQSKLKKETDSVRRAEEAKKGKVTANRREEELQLKDSIYKLRRTRFPQLANFLLTSDVINDDDEPETSSPFNLSTALPTRSHPPPVYYLPAILTPSQEAFLSRRKAQFKEASEREWETFKAERQAGIEEILSLRKKVAEEEERKKMEREKEQETKEQANETSAAAPSEEKPEESQVESRDVEMELDEPGKDDREIEVEKKDDDEDDAVEY